MRNQLTLSMTAMVLGFGLATLPPVAAQAQMSIGISVGFAPPPLPFYDQPPIPGYGYFWTPGYWAWDGGINDYYWVPGTWVRPPRIGYLWTPAYWGFSGGRFIFNNGYWGQRVGFYGGINYGFGYDGNGYGGGYWRGDRLYYNRYVNNISNARITTVYTRVVVRNSTNRISYVGGIGGIHARPSSEQLMVMRGAHVGPTPIQLQHRDVAARDPSLRAAVNHGVPPVAATRSPGQFRGADVVPARPVSGADHSSGPTPSQRTGSRSPGTNYAPQPHSSTQVDRMRPVAQPHQPTAPQPNPPVRHESQQSMPDQRLARPQQRPTPQPEHQRQPGPPQQQQDHQRPQPGPQRRAAPDGQQGPSAKPNGKPDPGA